jgi:transposase
MRLNVKLDEKRENELKQLLSYPIGYRAKIILLSSKGMSTAEISKKLKIHVQNVRKWIKRYLKYGWIGLLETRGGWNRTSVAIEDIIINVARKKPFEFNLPFKSWSVRKLEKFINKKNIAKLSYVTIWKILKKRGVYLKSE